MTPERWQQIDHLFHATLAHGREQRSDFLARACAGDESLRREVESLVSFHREADSFIDTSVGDVAAELLSDYFQLQPGYAIQNYKIVRHLETGGMGEIYLADDLRLDRKVALKLLPPQFTVDSSHVRRFVQEARAASALNHPNIVTIHEIGQAASTHFIATEFIDGVTLREHLAVSQMTLHEILEVAVQVAGALKAAHDAGIVHRDIKPENIMVRRDGFIKVLDFGLAKLSIPALAIGGSMKSPQAMLKTDPGVVMGTVQYMSPEQARGEEMDARTDIWSLGVVLYEMLTGHLPFTGETSSHLLVSIIESEPLPMRRFVALPAKLERLVLKMLRKKVDERYQSADELAHELKNIRQEIEIEARLLRVTRQTDEQLLTNQANTVELVSRRQTSNYAFLKKHRRVALTVCAALLIGLVSFLVYLKIGAGPNAINKERIASIAVLPFVNTSHDPNAEYLSDGLSQSLINALSQLPKLKVTARSSAFEYKDKQIDVEEAGRSLGVETILTGRVTQMGSDLLISAELTDARDGTQLWGEQYNRNATDLLAVQSEISNEIARALKLRLTPAEERNLIKQGTVNPQAYELLLKGRFYVNQGGTENVKKALEYFKQAIDVDPSYALAYALLSLKYGDLVNANVLDQAEFIPKSEALALKALELDDGLAEAHLAMAAVKTNAWDWTAAEREIKRALELNPNLASAHVAYTFFLFMQGRYEQALTEARLSRDLDPLSLESNAVVVYSLLLAGQNDDALQSAQKLLELSRNNPNLHGLLAQIYTARREHANAVAAWQEAIRTGDSSPDAQVFLGAAYARVGQPQKTKAILKKLENGTAYVSPTGLAVLYASLGDQEQALALLERAYAAHDQQLIWLGVERGVIPDRDDPRFIDLMNRVGVKR